jgi:succinate dehydrogenase/fumarate reductase-like Fe-S protein
MTPQWEFNTARFRVTFTALPEELDPSDSFSDPADIEAVRTGDVAWFCAKVAVECDGHQIAADYLGACAYRTVEEFVTGHRDPDPLNRNSSIMRAARGGNVVICHYFPDMVRTAIAEARKNLADLQSVKLRQVP